MKKLKFKKEVERLIIAFTVINFVIAIIPGSVGGSAIAALLYYLDLVMLYNFGHLKDILKEIF